MKNEIKEQDIIQRPNLFRVLFKSQFSGYIILVLVLAAFQILYMTTGIITLTISRAISQTIIYTIAAMGLSLLLGMAGLTSLGTAAFIGLGAYLAGNMMKNYDLPYTAVLLVVLIVGLFVGVVVGFLSLRTRGVHLLIITLSLATVLQDIYIRPNSFTGGPNGVTGVPFPKLFMALQLDRDTTFFLLLAMLLILVILTINIIISPSGRALLAMKNSQPLAQAMGINILKYRVLAFAIATEYAMLAGAMYVSYLGSSTASTWSTTLSLNILAAIVLGGGLKPAGAIMGSFVLFGLDLGILKNIPYFQKNSSASLIFSGILMILIVVKYPGGLARMLVEIRNGVQSLLAKWRSHNYGPNK